MGVGGGGVGLGVTPGILETPSCTRTMVGYLATFGEPAVSAAYL